MVRTAEMNHKYIRTQIVKAQKLIQRLKINGCAICGYNECDASLDFHHVNPEDKKFPLTLSDMNRSGKSIVEELIKCILLCKNCHAKLHYEENKNDITKI